MMQGKQRLNRQGMLYAVDPVINLQTLNYLLHGLQRYGPRVPGNPHTEEHKRRVQWRTLWISLGLNEYFDDDFQSRMFKNASLIACSDDENTIGHSTLELRELRFLVAKHIVQNCITPFGVPRGSEKQGGQHQGVNFKSVTWPVDFVTSCLIDGKCTNLMNFWRQYDLHAGDDLMLFLQDKPTTEYHLSGHPRSMRKMTFPTLSKAKYGEEIRFASDKLDALHNKEKLWDFWEKITKTKELTKKIRKEGLSGKVKLSDKFCIEPLFQLVPGTSSSHLPEIEDAVWEQGFWHIARCQVMQLGFNRALPIHSDATSLLNGKLLQATFEPVWMDGHNARHVSDKRLWEEHAEPYESSKRKRTEITEEEKPDTERDFSYNDMMYAAKGTINIPDIILGQEGNGPPESKIDTLNGETKLLQAGQQGADGPLHSKVSGFPPNTSTCLSCSCFFCEDENPKPLCPGGFL